MSSTTGVGVAEDPSAAIDRLNNGRSPPIGVRKRSVNSQVSQVAERTITDLSSTTPTSLLKPHRRVTAREYLNLITPPKRDAVTVAPGAQARSLRDDLENGPEDSTQQINNNKQKENNKESNMVQPTGNNFGQLPAQNQDKIGQFKRQGGNDPALQLGKDNLVTRAHDRFQALPPEEQKNILKAFTLIVDRGDFSETQTSGLFNKMVLGVDRKATKAEKEAEALKAAALEAIDVEVKNVQVKIDKSLAQGITLKSLINDCKNDQNVTTNEMQGKKDELNKIISSTQKYLQNNHDLIFRKILDLPKDKTGVDKEIAVVGMILAVVFYCLLLGVVLDLINFLVSTNKGAAEKLVFSTNQKAKQFKQDIKQLTETLDSRSKEIEGYNNKLNVSEYSIKDLQKRQTKLMEKFRSVYGEKAFDDLGLKVDSNYSDLVKKGLLVGADLSKEKADLSKEKSEEQMIRELRSWFEDDKTNMLSSVDAFLGDTDTTVGSLPVPSSSIDHTAPREMEVPTKAQAEAEAQNKRWDEVHNSKFGVFKGDLTDQLAQEDSELAKLEERLEGTENDTFEGTNEAWAYKETAPEGRTLSRGRRKLNTLVRRGK